MILQLMGARPVVLYTQPPITQFLNRFYGSSFLDLLYFLCLCLPYFSGHLVVQSIQKHPSVILFTMLLVIIPLWCPRYMSIGQFSVSSCVSIFVPFSIDAAKIIFSILVPSRSIQCSAVSNIPNTMVFSSWSCLSYENGSSPKGLF